MHTRCRPHQFVALLLITAMTACGDDGSATTDPTTAPAASTVPGSTEVSTPGDRVSGPAPEAMCPDGEYPMAAAYDRQDGSFRWVACTAVPEMYILKAVTADTVWVEQVTYEGSVARLDAATGAFIDEQPGHVASGVPAGADVPLETPPLVDGVQVRGGQDDPLVAIDTSTGQTVWSANGHPWYDNVWASADGVLFIDATDPAFTPSTGAFAFEVTTGEVRWVFATEDGYGTPWHATGEHVFLLGTDLWVLSTADGTELWRTRYGDTTTTRPRLFGVLANEEMVVVSFTMRGSDGD